MTYYVFFETDGDFGRVRQTYGFTSQIACDVWVNWQLTMLAGREGEDLSDLEYWEAPQAEWPHVRILA